MQYDGMRKDVVCQVDTFNISISLCLPKAHRAVKGLKRQYLTMFKADKAATSCLSWTLEKSPLVLDIKSPMLFTLTSPQVHPRVPSSCSC